MRRSREEDIALTEVSKISFDHQRQQKFKKEKIIVNRTEVEAMGVGEKEVEVNE